MGENKLLTAIGAISGLITIIDVIIKSVNFMKFYISNTAITFFIITMAIILLIVIFSKTNIKYIIKSRISYMFSKRNYTVLSKECIYTYISRTELKYKKIHTIQSNTSNVTSFSDKFKWSVEQKLDDIKISCLSCGTNMILKREENWHCYTINFPAIVKGNKKTLPIEIVDLKDPDKRALPFLSSNIIDKTKKLVLKVVFSSDVDPQNFKYKIFDNYSSNCPIYCEDKDSSIPLKKRHMHYDQETHTLSVTELYPIEGYKYLLSWDFKGEESENVRYF